MTPTCHSRRPRGFFLVDITLGLLIATALLLAFSMAVGRLHRAQRQLAQAREASRRLEASLLNLQTGGQIEAGIQLQQLSAGPAGHVWVRLTLPPEGPNEQPSTLVGLIPGQPTGGAP